MPVRTANAVWEGNLPEGKGNMKFGGGAFDGQYSFSSRFEEGAGTNPEELVAAAQAGCFSMAFSNGLAKAGYTPTRVQTEAKVQFDKKEEGFRITKIILNTEGEVPGIDEATFQQQAEAARTGCPMANALSPNIVIEVNARLVGQ